MTAFASQAEIQAEEIRLKKVPFQAAQSLLGAGRLTSPFPSWGLRQFER